MKRLIFSGMVLALAGVGGCDFIGGGDTVIRGSDNLVVRDASRDRVAKALAGFDAVPAVTDDELRQMYATIRERAIAGDLDAMAVMLRLAAIQRAPADDEEEE